MGLKVKLHRRARSDLAGIRRYLLDRAGPQAAERTRKHLTTRILRLGEFPEIGVATSTPAIRVLAPTVYPYRIYFMVGDETVVILHIRHTSRREADPEDLS